MMLFLNIGLSVITVLVTLIWMLKSSDEIVEYMISFKDAGKDFEYHFEYLKIIVAFLLNFILFKDAAMDFFRPEDDSFFVFIKEIVFLVAIIFVNRFTIKSFKF